MKLNIFAFFEASNAPAVSPAATLPLTWAAKITPTTPSGKQQKSEMIAGTKIVRNAGPVRPMGAGESNLETFSFS